MTMTYLAYEDRLIPMMEAPDHSRSEITLEAIMASRPESLALRGMKGIADLEQVASRLAVQEALLDLPDGCTKLWAVLGETPQSIRALTASWPVLPRVSALIFSPFRLLEEFGLALDTPLDQWPDALRMGRNLTVLTALSLKIPAYEWASLEKDFPLPVVWPCRTDLMAW